MCSKLLPPIHRPSHPSDVIPNRAAERNLLFACGEVKAGNRHLLMMVTHVIPLCMVEVREYLDPTGRSPFAEWFDGLNAPSAAKVATAVTRIGLRNFSNVKGVGAGVYEYKIDFGPGYRVYFGKDGETLVILLGGGTKRRQHRDIQDAIAKWQDYKRRKK